MNANKRFQNFVAKHMHKVHRPAVEANKRNKMLDDLAEREHNEDLTLAEALITVQRSEIGGTVHTRMIKQRDTTSGRIVVNSQYQTFKREN